MWLSVSWPLLQSELPFLSNTHMSKSGDLFGFSKTESARVAIMSGSSFVPYIFRCELERERAERVTFISSVSSCKSFFYIVFGQHDLAQTSKRIATIKELLFIKKSFKMTG